jgi:imidazole glycerol phosphate synthase subunit HisF
VTLARRLCALIEVDERGRPARPYSRGGLDATFVEAVAAFLVQDGIDEVWLRASPTKVAPDIKLLFDVLHTLEERVFAPLVAWAPIASPADARLLLSFGADRVVVDVHRGLPDPVAFIARIVEATGHDRVVAAVHARRMVTEKAELAFELVDPGGDGTDLSALVLIDQLQHVGAAEILLVPQKGSIEQGRVRHDGDLIERASSTLSIPLLSHADEADVADLATPLLMGADGVVSGLVGGGRPPLPEVRRALTEYGVPLRS